MSGDVSWAGNPWVWVVAFQRVTDSKPEVKHRPILFSGPMVRAILEGRKTQTRRLLEAGRYERDYHPFEDDRDDDEWPLAYWRGSGCPTRVTCPYGQSGDRLRVLESHEFLPLRVGERMLHDLSRLRIRYAADGAERLVTLTDEEVAKLKARKSPYTKPQPGRFMFLSCSRETLEITGLRVERLQEISEEDARAEGIGMEDLAFHPGEGGPRDQYRYAFSQLWDSINGKRRAA